MRRPRTPTASEIRSERVLKEIAAERERQIKNEGWTASHDDMHSAGELSVAAGCYAIHASGAKIKMTYDDEKVSMPVYWPFAGTWWKPKDQRRDLIRAAALIVAEIERIDRH